MLIRMKLLFWTSTSKLTTNLSSEARNIFCSLSPQGVPRFHVGKRKRLKGSETHQLQLPTRSRNSLGVTKREAVRMGEHGTPTTQTDDTAAHREQHPFFQPLPGARWGPGRFQGRLFTSSVWRQQCRHRRGHHRCVIRDPCGGYSQHPTESDLPCTTSPKFTFHEWRNGWAHWV